jgi:hypothetical protein
MKVRHIDLHADEFIAGVAGQLSPAELGVYLAVILFQCSRGGMIDNDAEWIAGLFKKGTKTAHVRDCLDALLAGGKLEAKRNQIGNKRAAKEIQSATKRISKWRQNGRKGGRPSGKTKDLPKPGGSDDQNPSTNHQPPAATTSAAAQAAPGLQDVLARIATITGKPVKDPAVVRQWLEAGYSPEQDVYPVIERRCGQAGFTFSTLAYFTNAIVEHRAKRGAVPPAAPVRPARRKGVDVHEDAQNRVGELEQWRQRQAQDGGAAA